MAITCGHCGARNVPEADYCIQCMESFGPLTLPKPPMRLQGTAPSGMIPPPPPVSTVATPAPVIASPSPAQPAPTQSALGAVSGGEEAATGIPSDDEIIALLSGTAKLDQAGLAVALTEEEVNAGRQTLNEEGIGIINGKPIWRCRQCEHLQPMTNFICAKCGIRFGAERMDPVANANFKRMEMMFPGYGFFQAGHLFTAITRIIVVTSWLATAIFVAFQRPLVAIPLLAGVGVLWFLGPQDIENVLLGHEPRLNGRGLLILITLVLLAFIFVGAADFYFGTSGLNQ